MPSALAKDCHIPVRGGGVGARRNKGRDPAQRSSGCSKGPWVNSTVLVMVLVRGGREGNPEAHVFGLTIKSILDGLGVTVPMALNRGVLAVPGLTT